MESIKKLMEDIELGFRYRGVDEVEYYRGIAAGFQIIRFYMGKEEDRQNYEQTKQFKEAV